MHAFVVIAALLFVVGCPAASGNDDDSAGGDPSLTLTAPADGDIVCGTPLQIRTTVENFTLTNEAGDATSENIGHVHAYLNGQEVAQSDQTAIDVNDVADQEYQLTVDLARLDHTALDPYVGTTIYVTVDHTICLE